jgi:hypothetical protein
MADALHRHARHSPFLSMAERLAQALGEVYA